MPSIPFPSAPIYQIITTLVLVLFASSVTAQIVVPATSAGKVQTRPAAAETVSSGNAASAMSLEAAMRLLTAAVQSGNDMLVIPLRKGKAAAAGSGEVQPSPAAAQAVPSGEAASLNRPKATAAAGSGEIQPSSTAAQAVPPGEAASLNRPKATAAAGNGEVQPSPAAAQAVPPGEAASIIRSKRGKAAAEASTQEVQLPASVSPAVPPGNEMIVIPLGELKTLPISGKITRIAVGNGKIVSATTVDNHLLLIAEQVGRTEIMVWSSQGTRTFRVQVAPPQFASTRRLLQDIVDHNTGLQLQEVDSRLVVTGIAHTPVIDQLQKIASDLPYVLVNVEADQGSAATQSVLFRLYFIEVKKSLLEKIGIQWGSSMSGLRFGVQGAQGTGIYRTKNIRPPPPDTDMLADGRPIYSVGGRTSGLFLGIASALTSSINLGVSDGDARILAIPELTAKNGGQAKLQVGGEVPIPLASAFGSTTVEFKPYGILFDIAPTVDLNGTITAKISTELSQIDPSVTVRGIPGFLTRSTSTEISVKAGDVFALSGLLSGELSNSIDKVPGLGNIPILGRLFSSDDYRNQRTDLVVLVQTEIINSGAGMANEVLQRGQRNLQEYQALSQQRTSSGGRRPLERNQPSAVPAAVPVGGN